MTEFERIEEVLRGRGHDYNKIGEMDSIFKYHQKYWEHKQRKLYSFFKSTNLYQFYSESPESIYLKKEHNQELIFELKRTFTEQELYIYWLYYIEKFSQEEVAQLVCTYQRKISRILKKLEEKCLKMPKIIPYIGEIYNEIGYPRTSKENPVTKYSNTFPFERSMPNKARKKKYCSMPQYLNASFGDADCKCGLCFDQFGRNSCIFHLKCLKTV